MLVICIVACCVGLLGQWLDGYTTYQGVRKFGPSIEGDKSALTKWLIARPSRLLYAKPLFIVGVYAAIIISGYWANDFLTALVCVTFLNVPAAVFGFMAASSNNKVNHA